MKKIFTLFTLIGIGLSASAQRLLTEDFNYATGNLTDAGAPAPAVSAGAWTTNTGAGNYLQVVSGSLIYPNYFTAPSAASATNNKLAVVSFATSSEDAFRSFTPVTAGTVYASFILNVTDPSTLDAATVGTGDYFMAFIPSTSTSAYTGRLYIRKGPAAAGNTFTLGIAPISIATTPAVWSTTEYTAGVPHIITMAYTIVAGTANDVVKLFVDAPYSATEPTPTVSAIVASGESADIGRLGVRQGTTLTPTAFIDAIKVSTTYADATLPLSLTSFKASLNSSNAVQLNWSVANEINVKSYTVERSSNSTTFSEIGSAFANTNLSTYTFTDSRPLTGINYYRLKMTDTDGSIKYSAIVSISNSKSLIASVFPNPVIGNLSVSHTKASAGALIKILDAEGKQVKTFTVENGAIQTSFSVGNFIKGSYILVFENNGEKTTTKFVKQ